MTITKVRFALAGAGLLAISVALCVCSVASAQQAPSAHGRNLSGRNLTQPVYRVPRQPRVAAVTSVRENLATAQAAAPAQPEHPLIPAIRLAKSALANIDNNITDYTATLIKRENMDGKLGEYQYMYLKVRHKPFSAYMYFLGPKETKGRECLYVSGQNDNKLIAHESPRKLINGTFHLDPTGFIAMRNQKYPITDIGIRNLTAKLIEVAENDVKLGGQCEVKWYKGTKIGKGDKARICTCMQVIHPVKRPGFQFHTALIFIDDELNVPIRYQAFQWPKKAGGKPVLDEEYTYRNLKLNQGLTDADFVEKNASYNFK